jgi:hypothetical protein
MTEQAPDIFDVAINGAWQLVRVHSVAVWLLCGVYTKRAFDVGEQPMMTPSMV